MLVGKISLMHAVQHIENTSISPLHPSQTDIPRVMQSSRCKAQYETNFWKHTGTRTHAYSSSKGDYIVEAYLGILQTISCAKYSSCTDLDIDVKARNVLNIIAVIRVLMQFESEIIDEVPKVLGSFSAGPVNDVQQCGSIRPSS